MDNGLDVVYDLRSMDSVAVELSVRVGSDNEPKGLEGISHFLEHMMFEGTKRRRDSRAIANVIESLGGELNAATSNDRTFYYVKVPKKHFEVALDVLSDIMLNAMFPARGFGNNKKVILNEISMVNDEPLYYQWIMFYRELFKGSPIGKPVYGNVEAVGALKRSEMISYFRRNYGPGNMVLGIAGGVGEAELGKVEDYFTLKKTSCPDNRVKAPAGKKGARVVRETRSINQSYMVLGYRTVPRMHEDSYVLDVIDGVLGRGQSGWMFDEIRNKRALAYNVGVDHNPELDFGMFAINVGTKGKNVDKVAGIIQKNLKRLQNLSARELSEAKAFVEGNRILELEDNLGRAEAMCFFEQAGDFREAGKYLEKINGVKLEDVRRVAEEYLNDDYTLTVLSEGKV